VTTVLPPAGGLWTRIPWRMARFITLTQAAHEYCAGLGHRHRASPTTITRPDLSASDTTQLPSWCRRPRRSSWKKKACCIDRTSSTAESQRPTRHTRAPARRAVADKAVRLRPSGFRRHVAWRRRGCRSAAAGGLTFTVFQGWTWRHSRRAYFIVCQAAATRSEVCGARALTAQAGVHLHKTRFSTPSHQPINGRGT